MTRTSTFHRSAPRANLRSALLAAAILTCSGWSAAGAHAEPAATPAHGRLFIYPSRGQDQARLDDDRYQCHVWARTQSGFDPSQGESPGGDAEGARGREPVQERNPAEGAAATGAVAGAVLGAAIGAHSHDALEGAVIGAAAGAIAGGTIEADGARSARRAVAERDAREAQADASAEAAQRADYRRAIIACLEGRGYTVR